MNKLLYVLHAISLCLIPFLNKAQLVQDLALSTSTHDATVKTNHAPCASDDFKTICENSGPVNIAVQANDHDPDGDPMVTSIVTGPTNGSATVVGGTQITYTPNPGFDGIDYITYSICDDGWPIMCDNAVLKVTVKAGPLANAGADVSICTGGTTVIGTPAVAGNTYVWTPASGLSSAFAANPTANPSSTTTYNLTVTKFSTGCSASDAVTVTVKAMPIANAGANQTICAGASVTLGSPAVAGYTYLWSPATGLSSATAAQPIATPATTTTYTLVVSNGICTSVDDVCITVNPLPTANAGADATICAGASTVIGTPAVAGHTYSWSPSAGLSSSTAAQPTANPTSTTSYTLTVTNTATGCTKTDVVLVNVNALPIVNAGADASICVGASTVIGTAASAGLSYTWSPSAGLSSAVIAQPTASPAATTTYTLTASNAAGCSASDNVTITVNALPVANAGADVAICAGSTAVIGSAAVSGYTYLWTPALGLSSVTAAQPTASPLVTTTYNLTVTNGTGCIANDAVTVTVNALPAANAGADVAICTGSSTVIGSAAVIGDTYAWSPSAGLSSTTAAQPTANPTVTTTYTLTVTNAAGCTKTDAVVVTVNPAATANAGADVAICTGSSTVIGSAAVSGSTYLWTPALGLSSATAAQPTANPLITTTYTLTVTNASGCTASDAVTVTVSPLPTVNAGVDISVCAGGSGMIGSAAVSGSTYLWTPAIGLSSTTVAQPTANPTVTTTYTLTVTNAAGCSASDVVVVTVNPAATANAGADVAICAGSSTVIGSAAVSGNTYLWSPALGLSSATAAQPTANPLVTTTYTLTVTNASGCTASDAITVTVNPLVIANAGADVAICAGSSSVIGLPGLIGNTYLWSPATGLSSTSAAQPTASPTVTTTYTLTVTNAAGCSASDVVVVTVNPAAAANAGADVAICAGSSTVIGSAAVSGNTYLWTPALGLSSATAAQPTANPLLTTTYTLTVTNASGCTGSDAITVTVNPLPIANAGADVAICTGGSVTIGSAAVIGNTYSWSPALGLSSATAAQPTANPLVTTTYTLTVTNAAGCSASDAVTVTVNPLPGACTVADQNICAGDSVQLGMAAVAGVTYSWSPAVGLSSSTEANPWASPSVTTTYTLTTTSAAGCVSTHTVTVHILPAVTANAGADASICAGASVVIGSAAVSGNTYLWTPAIGLSSATTAQPTANPAVTTTYYLTVLNAATGCFGFDTVTITVNPLPVANAGADVAICAGGSVVIGSAAVSGNTYLWTPAFGLSSSVVAQPNASPLVSTTYYLTVTNAAGCSASDSVIVTVNPMPGACAVSTQYICPGDSVHLGMAAVAGVTYSWSPATGLSSATDANPLASPTVSTTYTLVTTNEFGCSNSHVVIVNVHPAVDANAGADAAVCVGGSAMIGSPALSGYTYVWSPALGLSSAIAAQPTATPLVTTSYYLTVTDTLTGCFGIDTVIVTVNPSPVADAGNDTTICSGSGILIGSATLSGHLYNWSPAAGLSSTTVAQPTASPLVTTTYVVTVTNNVTGCSSTDSVTIVVNPLPGACAVTTQTICPGDSVHLGMDPVPGVSYSWSPAAGLSSSTAANPLASPTVTTSYTLTTTNEFGCTNSHIAIVNVNPAVVANAGADVSICVGGSAVIGSAALSEHSYLWTPGPGLTSPFIAQPTASPALTTTYYLMVTNDTTGCFGTDSVTVTVNGLPGACTVAEQTICHGDSVALGMAPVAGVTYSWSPAAGLSSSTEANPMASPDTTTTYTLTTTNEFGCTNSHIVTVNVLPAIEINAGADQTTCEGSSVTIGMPAVDSLTYSWSPATGLSSTTVAQPTATLTGSITYTLVVTDENGCTGTDEVVVTINAQPLANTGGDHILCLGSSITLGGEAVKGNTYVWTPGTGLSSTTSANPVANPTVTTTYILTESAGPGCVSSDTVTITVVEPPVANAGSDQTICNGASVVIGVAETGFTTYSWSPATGLSSATVAQPTANPAVTTNYILTVTNTLTGCSDTDTMVVNVNTLPGVNAGADVTVCFGESVLIGSAPHKGSTYVWTPSAGLSSVTEASTSASPFVTTTYVLTETSVDGCVGSDTVTVTVDNSLTANAGADVSTCAGSPVMIGTASAAEYTYLWYPATGLSSTTVAQPNASPEVTTTYVVFVTNPLTGCTDADTIVVNVNPLPAINAGVDQGICSADTCVVGVEAIVGYTYSWSPGTGLSATDIANPFANPAVTTTYTLTVSDGICTATDEITVTVNSFPDRLAGFDQLICDGGGVMIGSPAIPNYTYSWSPTSNISSSTSAEPVVMVANNTVYVVTVHDTVNGCMTTDSVLVNIQGGGLYNGFSPNGDGINDDWTIPMLECYPQNKVIILNRYGAEVWKGVDYNNRAGKWDGKNINGEALPDGTYYYVIAYNDLEKRGWVFIKR
ncbi:MAG TPA: gliding motility-associated C-terminal domain-containing protein [Flavobacteriales bacterium]|nr:gliding motility-associated C-terminal domain-containing protein [Flavobacteriales bacterium]